MSEFSNWAEIENVQNKNNSTVLFIEKFCTERNTDKIILNKMYNTYGLWYMVH